jgi:vesicle coat complex subunit
MNNYTYNNFINYISKMNSRGSDIIKSIIEKMPKEGQYTIKMVNDVWYSIENNFDDLTNYEWQQVINIMGYWFEISTNKYFDPQAIYHLACQMLE